MEAIPGQDQLQPGDSRSGGTPSEGPASKRQRIEGQKAEELPDARHVLIDPSLVALRLRLAAGPAVPSLTLPVASPLAGDTRLQPFAPTLLDLRIRGAGAGDAKDSGCPTSRVELAIVSGYYAAHVMHEPPQGCLAVPVGHAGVELLMDAMYTKRVELGASTLVDLLQAASYMQVECCLATAGKYLMAHVLQHHPVEVLRVARTLGLQDVLKEVGGLLVSQFFTFPADQLAAMLLELGAGDTSALLARQDLCCPLQCFIVHVLAHMACQEQQLDLGPLLECVRWDRMSQAELRATVLLLRGVAGLPPAASAALAWRLAEAATDKLQTIAHAHYYSGQAPAPRVRMREAAMRTPQLVAAVTSAGMLAGAQHGDPLDLPGSGGQTARLTATGVNGGEEVRLSLTGYHSVVGARLVGWFLVMDASGLRCLKASFSPQQGFYKPGFLTPSLSQPLRSGQNGKGLLLLGCYMPAVNRLWDAS